MKVGLSFSRCVRDIVQCRVAIQDVMVIIGGTDFDPNDDYHWAEIWDAYSQGEWADYAYLGEDHFRDIVLALYTSGRLHQWRRFVDRGQGRPGPGISADWTWLDTMVPPDQATPPVLDAWERYKVVAGLARIEREIV